MSAFSPTKARPRLARLGLGLCVSGLVACGALNDARDRLMGGKGGGASRDERSAKAPVFALNGSLATFQDCADVRAHYRQAIALRLENQRAQQEWLSIQTNTGVSKPGAIDRSDSVVNAPNAATMEDQAAPSQAGKAAPASESGTNVQEKGVDESDMLKVTSRHVFVAQGPAIQVVDRGTLTVLGAIPAFDPYGTRLFATDERLLVLGRDGASSRVDWYALEAGKMPVAMGTWQAPGYLQEARVTGGKLYVVIQDRLDVAYPGAGGVAAGRPRDVGAPDVMTKKVAPAEPDFDTVRTDEGDQSVAGVPCQNVVKPPYGDGDAAFTKVAALPVSGPATPAWLAIPGSGGALYMTENTLYLTKTDMAWVPWVAPQDYPDWSARWRDAHDSTVVTLVGLKDEGPGAYARGVVPGRVKDQWSFREFPGAQAVAIASTRSPSFRAGGVAPQPQPAPMPSMPGVPSRYVPVNGRAMGLTSPPPPAPDARNHMTVLRYEDGRLNPVAQIGPFGKPGEDIRAVRYVGDYAYVVTFRQTDPLYAFDFSQPLAPRMVDALEVPGFSAYLHPAKDGRLIGVGMAADPATGRTQGVQVSLFDSHDPSRLALMDAKTFGAGSDSETLRDHHAFWFDDEREWFAFPVVERNVSAPVPGAPVVPHAATVVFGIENGRLTEKARLSHADLAQSTCRNGQGVFLPGIGYATADVNRVVSLDGALVSVSRAGLKRHPFGDLAHPDKSVSFPLTSAACQPIYQE